MSLRQHPNIAHLEFLQIKLIGRRLDREDDLSPAATSFALGVGKFVKLTDKLLHALGHPTPRHRWMVVVASIAGEGGDAHILVEELDPVQSIAYHRIDKVSGDLPRHGGPNAACKTRSPVCIPILAPQLAVVHLADRSITPF